MEMNTLIFIGLVVFIVGEIIQFLHNRLILAANTRGYLDQIDNLKATIKNQKKDIEALTADVLIYKNSKSFDHAVLISGLGVHFLPAEYRKTFEALVNKSVVEERLKLNSQNS